MRSHTVRGRATTRLVSVTEVLRRGPAGMSAAVRASAPLYEGAAHETLRSGEVVPVKPGRLREFLIERPGA